MFNRENIVKRDPAQKIKERNTRKVMIESVIEIIKKFKLIKKVSK